MFLGSTWVIKLTTLSPAAHMVVIKGVMTFQNNASVEYSDLDIMQMLGRAVSIYIPFLSV